MSVVLYLPDSLACLPCREALPVPDMIPAIESLNWRWVMLFSVLKVSVPSDLTEYHGNSSSEYMVDCMVRLLPGKTLVHHLNIW